MVFSFKKFLVSGEKIKNIIIVNCGKYNDFNFYRILCVYIEYIVGGLWGDG